MCLEKPLGLCSQHEMERRKGKELTLKEHLLYSQHCAGLSASVAQLIFNQPCEVGPSIAVKNLPKVAKLESGLYGRGLEPRAVGLYVVGEPWHNIFQSQRNLRIQKEVDSKTSPTTCQMCGFIASLLWASVFLPQNRVIKVSTSEGGGEPS